MAKPEVQKPAVYPNAPVRLVVLSVEYPTLGVSDQQVKALREALRDEFPLVDHQAEARYTFAVGAAPAAHQQLVTFPSFSTRDRATRVVVTPDQVVVETRAYEEFDWYLDLVGLTVASVGEVLVPDGVTGIGHRFIDEVHLPGGALGELDRWFLPELIAMPGLVDPPVEVWQAVVSYQLDSASRLTLRYGPLEASLVPEADGRIVSFTNPVIGLDWDSRWVPSSVPEFEAQAITDRLAEMYEPVRTLFRRICTDELRERFDAPPRGGR